MYSFFKEHWVKFLITFILLFISILTIILSYKYIGPHNTTFTLLTIASVIIFIVCFIWIWVNINPLLLASVIFIISIIYIIVVLTIIRSNCEIKYETKKLLWAPILALYIISMGLYTAMDNIYISYDSNYEIETDEVKKKSMLHMKNSYYRKRYYIPMIILGIPLYMSTKVNNTTASGIIILTETYLFIRLVGVAVLFPLIEFITRLASR